MDTDEVRSRENTNSIDTHDAVPTEQAPEHRDDRYSAVTQYSLAQILGVWAAAAIPMAVLAPQSLTPESAGSAD